MDPIEGGSSGNNSQGSDGSVKMVEIKIKTLDSQVYTCNVDQNISVPALKEHVATLTGVPVENQRLICRGKVLKDDHNLSAYNVEDGHTLHLVTRQAPQTGATSSAGASGGEEEQGGDDPSTTAARRPTQISHSVVMGTFNVPDNGDGGLPDVNRIISSVLSSLGIANLAPNVGANAGGAVGVTANPAFVVPGQEAAGRPQSSIDPGSQPQPQVVQATWPAAAPGFLPAIGQQVRLLQPAMVIPDALTTISHYLDGLEQALANNGMHANPVHTTSSALQGGAPPAIRGQSTPANLGALIRRTMGLVNDQAGIELERLSSQLVNEPNISDAGVRGELQSAALRDGVLLQHLGALLLELGRATLTLRMGASPTESAVNAGPAVFISAAGPNPIMVQPLPYQPGGGFGMPQHAGVMGFGEVPRNVSIHIHANDGGAIPGFPAPVGPIHVPPPVSTAIPSTGQASGPASNPPATSITPAVHAIAVPMQASNTPEQPGIRVVPMRTVVAAVPGRPMLDTSGAHANILHPLLARFQQLNPQQAGGQQAAGVQGPHNGAAPVPPAGTVAPTIRAQVQVQAWVPDGQGGTRLVSNEEALRTLFTPAMHGASLSTPQQQTMPDVGTAHANNQTVSASDTPPHVQQLPRDVPEEPIEAAVDHAEAVARGPSSEAEIERNKGKDQAMSSQTEAMTASGSSNPEPKGAKTESEDTHTRRVPAGLGLGGLQLLPSRTPKRSARQPQGTQSTGTSNQNHADMVTADENGSVGGQGGSPLVPGSSRNVTQSLNNVPQRRGDTGNLDLGSLISQLTGGSGGGTTAPSRAREAGQGVGLPAGALGSLMGQVMQNPFMRNVVQQVVEQVGDGGLDQDDTTAQGVRSQSALPQDGLDFSRLLQEMMPLVSQAINRVSTTDQASGHMQGIDMRAGDSSAVRGNAEGTRDGMARVQDMISNGLSASNGANLPALLQQMMPVVAQAFGGSLSNRPEHPSSGANLGSRLEDGRIAGTDAQQVDEDTPQSDEVSEQTEGQESAPVAKRQKIDVAKALMMLEQGSSPDEILKVMAETASMLMESDSDQQADASLLAEHLCQDDHLVDDYMALLLRDLSKQNEADS